MRRSLIGHYLTGATAFALIAFGAYVNIGPWGVVEVISGALLGFALGAGHVLRKLANAKPPIVELRGGPLHGISVPVPPGAVGLEINGASYVRHDPPGEEPYLVYDPLGSRPTMLSDN